jgi:hypothetical protein
MRSFVLAMSLMLSTSVSGALPGVTDFRTNPEEITDTQLAAMLDARVAPADLVALGETVHGSSRFLRIQTRLIRYLVEKHGFRLVVSENPTLRSLELGQWVSSCTRARTRAPVEVLYMPTASDLPLLEWICEFNRAHPADPIVFRGMDVWDRPWEHYARIRALGRRAGIDPALLKSIEACPAHDASSWTEIEYIYGQVSQGGHTFSFFPSNAAFLREHPKWWIQNQNYPGPYESGVELVLPDHFDAFFVFARSRLDKALPARPMWQP